MPKTKKHRIKKNYKPLTRKILPKLTNKEITKILYPISLDDAIKDYNKLKNIDCADLKRVTIIGSDFVNYFTVSERLNTKSRVKISFFYFVNNFKQLYNQYYYIRNGINNLFKGNFFKTNDKTTILRNLKSFYRLYMGNVGFFRPAIVKDIICKYKPKKMLDFTMGWGGRLVGACVENIESYIGIDLNTNLEPLYKKMVKTLNKLSTTKIKLIFKDALKVDYSKLDYDFVLTSPPYYNIEVYSKNAIISEEEWNETFYKPIFSITYKYLKSGGLYCLNIPDYIYNDIAVEILGKCDEKIPLGVQRITDKEYSEYIYIWKK